MSIIEDDDNRKRIDKYIDDNDCKQKDYERIFVRGKKKILSVYRLPTEFLYFNIENGRFAAEYLEIKICQSSRPYEEGPELIARKCYNDIMECYPVLKKLINNHTTRKLSKKLGKF